MTRSNSEVTMKTATALLLLSVTLPVTAGDVWLRLPNGDLVSGKGELMVKESYGYMNARNTDQIIVDRNTAMNSRTGEAYIGNPLGGAYSGPDGAVGYVSPRGDIFDLGP